MLNYLESQGLTLSDDLFTIQLVNFIDGSDRPVHYSRLLAPIAAQPAS